MKNYDEFLDFMDQYTDYLIDVAEKEKQKLEALESDDLTEINRILSDYQVYIKKTELFEKRREELFRELGLEGKTFREIIETEPAEYRDELEDLFCSFRDAVTDTREYNRRSLEIVRKNLRSTEVFDYEGISDPACYDRNGSFSDESFTGKSILNKQA